MWLFMYDLKTQECGSEISIICIIFIPLCQLYFKIFRFTETSSLAEGRINYQQIEITVGKIASNYFLGHTYTGD